MPKPTSPLRAGCISLLIPLLVALGCAPSDKSVIQQAQGFDANIKPAEIRDPTLNQYLQQIGDRVIAAARESDKAGFGPPSHFAKDQSGDWMYKGIQFHLVNSKTLNAFTTGGEHVYIYNELFQLCRNEDDLAAVMSHEFGHIYCRHVQKGTQRQYGILAGALGLGAAGYVAGGKEHGADYAQTAAAVGMVAGNFAGMHFTRGDEAQADEVGFHFYTLAGWDPNKFGEFFQIMIDKGYDTTPELASDHPTLASRVEAANKRAKNLPSLPKDMQSLRKPAIADAAQFRRLQQQAQVAAANTPNDKSLANSKLLLAAIPRSCWMPVEPPDQKQARAELQAKLEQQQQQSAQSGGK
jgi:predicted Zn-dependent protease